MQKKLTMHCPRAAVLMIPWSRSVKYHFPFQSPLHLQIYQAQFNLLKILVLFWECGPHILLHPRGHRSYQGVPVLVMVTVKLWETVAALPDPLLVNLYYPCSAFSQARIIRGWPGMS